MVIIIGAGPAGIALAYELQKRGIHYRVLERERVGFSWTQHYDRLHLHTHKDVSALPGMPMPASYPAFPSAAQLQAYLQRYADHLGLHISAGVALERADFEGGQWLLSTSRGALSADVLVMASGIWSAPVLPAAIDVAAFGGPVTHSSAYRNPRPYLGQRVLVVGPGNSGSEIAVDLAEHGVSAAIAVRGGVAFGPKLASPQLARALAGMFRTLPRPLAEPLLRRRDFRHLGLPLPSGSALDHYPVVGYALPTAVAAGRVAVYPALERVSASTAHFADGRAAAFDAMIMATGYRPALDPVAHELSFDAHGRPQLDGQWRALANPRLVCVGYTYPTTEGWLQAIGRVTRRAAEGIVQLRADDRARLRVPA